LVEHGLSAQDFADAMRALVGELGDDHSYAQDPRQVQEEKRAIASQYDFVGIGALFTPLGNTGHAAVMSVFDASPAAAAGLQPHDVLLAVDGGPVRDSAGKSRTLGVEGTKVWLQIRRPEQAEHELTLTRRRVSGRLPIEYCLLAEARIGYMFLPTLLDRTMADQVREALRDMTAGGPMNGLVLDNRMNGGGLGSVTQAILGLFVDGSWGEFVTRSSREPLRLEPEDIGGSQRVPLVVLVDHDTVSYGEIMSGVLRVSGRATIVGGHTAGNVEQLRAYDLPENWRVWLASATFQPRGMTNGVWERVGIVPDISLPTRWDLFTERDDPALAKAVEVLGTHR
jgi:carboxyl-terminal processing protease